MKVEFKKRRKGRRHDGTFQRFDGETNLTDALKVLGYRLENINEDKMEADVWQGGRMLLKEASIKTIWG